MMAKSTGRPMPFRGAPAQSSPKPMVSMRPPPVKLGPSASNRPAPMNPQMVQSRMLRGRRTM
jgi:hypothetical protein